MCGEKTEQTQTVAERQFMRQSGSPSERRVNPSWSSKTGVNSIAQRSSWGTFCFGLAIKFRLTSSPKQHLILEGVDRRLNTQIQDFVFASSTSHFLILILRTWHDSPSLLRSVTNCRQYYPHTLPEPALWPAEILVFIYAFLSKWDKEGAVEPSATSMNICRTTAKR